jgi:plasmid stabilization system protein ParE
MKARISGRAKSDLEHICAFICARQGPKAADRYLELAQAAARFMAQHPSAGPHPRWATRHKGLRFWVISRTNFLIYYLPDADGVSIERVLNGRRDVVRVMELSREQPPEWDE